MPMAAGRAPRTPAMVRGSVIIHRRRCGKPNCRCADGEALHEATVLSYSDHGRTRFVMLPADQAGAVRAAADAYRKARSALEDQANAGLADLVARFAKDRGGRA